MGVGHGLVLMASDMVVRMGVIVRMTMRMSVCAVLPSVALQPQATPQASDDHARYAPKPWVETLRDDVV